MADQTPDTPSLAWQRQQEAATLVRTCYEGPLAVRAAGKSFLPRFPREDEDDYADRLASSVFYDATGRTVRALAGLVFRKPPALATELPEPLLAMWEDVDMRGTHGDVFAGTAFREGQVDGHVLIFVDMERPAEQPATLADERAAGLRPYWILVRKQDVLGFRTERVGGKERLVHLRFRESITEPDGSYGERAVERVREYNLTAGRVEYTVHAQRGEEWVVDEAGTMSIDEISASVAYLGEKLGPLESAPPHLALALENVKHYQLVSDNDNVLHIASVPQLVVKGVDDLAAAVGPSSGWKIPADGNVFYAEPAGNGLEAAERRIQKSEQRMAFLALSMLMSESRQAETATSKRINKAEADSALAMWTRAMQDALEEAMRLSAKWLGLTLPESGAARWVELNTDFENLPIEPELARILADLKRDGDLSRDTLWEALRDGEVLPATFDPEVERERIAADTPPGMPGSGMGSFAGGALRIPGVTDAVAPDTDKEAA